MTPQPIPPAVRVSLAVLLNARDEILLLRRARTDSFAPGLWSLPGGHIRGDETPEQAVRRELKEEIGRDVSPAHCAPVRRFGPVRDTLHGGRFEVHLFLFRDEGGPVLRNAEHEEHAWVSREAYRAYSVVDGLDEDLAYLEVWTRA